MGDSEKLNEGGGLNQEPKASDAPLFFLSYSIIHSIRAKHVLWHLSWACPVLDSGYPGENKTWYLSHGAYIPWQKIDMNQASYILWLVLMK